MKSGKKQSLPKGDMECTPLLKHHKDQISTFGGVTGVLKKALAWKISVLLFTCDNSILGKIESRNIIKEQEGEHKIYTPHINQRSKNKKNQSSLGHTYDSRLSLIVSPLPFGSCPISFLLHSWVLEYCYLPRLKSALDWRHWFCQVVVSDISQLSFSKAETLKEMKPSTFSSK